MWRWGRDGVEPLPGEVPGGGEGYETCCVVSWAPTRPREWIEAARSLGQRVVLPSPADAPVRLQAGAPCSVLLLDCLGGGPEPVAWCRELRAAPGGAAVPVLAVRASTEPLTQRRLMGAGVDECGAEDAGAEGRRWALGRALRLSQARAEAGRLSRALAESEERFRLHARATSDALYDWDLTANAVDWSDRHEAVVRVEGAWNWWRESIHPEDRGRVVTALRQLHGKRGGDLWHQEFRFRRRGGGYAHVSDRAFLVRDPRGKVLRVIGAMTDISDRREAESALGAAREELERRLRERTAELDRQLAER
ncbi:MAG: PAS domain-containing protein, partial [Deferrisomatales bacterium]